ncbi:MAG: hypothetical protein HYY03_04430, partial [Chloroflexi bacterium]|nr:hypothetical protein [Chloroflexota bacterium]
YLVETYGQANFAQLFAEIKAGNTTDDALNAVYGFDQDGLENEWRASHGLPPRETPPPREEVLPTAPASGAPGPASQQGDGGTSIGVVVALVLGTLALAAVVALAGLTLARRFR